MPDNQDGGPAVDASVPHIARIYDYWLGGKDNFAADREAARLAMAATPTIVPGVQANRRFLGRAVRHMAGAGVRQFLDVGTGIPAASNTHEVAQSIAPHARVVYVDNDPIVLSHARALLTSTTGPTAYIDADAGDTTAILDQAAQTIDFSQPAGVMLMAILHCVSDDDDPAGIVAALLGACPAGSYLALRHPARDQVAVAVRAEASLSRSMGTRVTFRTREQVARSRPGWSWRSQASCRSRTGGPIPTPTAAARPRRCGAWSPASPNGVGRTELRNH